MTVTDNDVIDGIAYENNEKTLILEVYDHLGFEGLFEYDHLTILQDKLNTYMWYIESRQYEDVYPGRQFEEFTINVHFKHPLSDDCWKLIGVLNQKLEGSSARIVPIPPAGQERP